jgi:hypothetical protein
MPRQSFRVVFALVPFALCVLATLGFLDLGDLWTRNVAADVKRESHGELSTTP